MPRRTVGQTSEESNKPAFDYGPMVQEGVTMLKFGRSGKPHERFFKLSQDLRFITWRSGWLSSKLGSKHSCKFCLFF